MIRYLKPVVVAEAKAPVEEAFLRTICMNPEVEEARDDLMFTVSGKVDEAVETITVSPLTTLVTAQS
jgi:hypothetical protein